MKKLVSFTKLYPYAKTEAFLETEIDKLSQYFDEILIYPSSKKDYIRKMPSNVLVDDSLIVDFKKRKKALFISLVSGKFFKYLLDHFSKIKSIKDVSNLLRYSTYELYYSNIFKEKKIVFEENIVYSYWFSHIVHALNRYKKKNKLNFDIITRAHRWDIYEDYFSFFPYRKETISSIKNVYSISDDGKQYLEERYGNEKRIKVARLGVFDREMITKKSQGNKFVFASVAQVTERKRIFLVYNSIKIYASQNPTIDVSWVHFGTGDKMEELKGLVKNITLPNLKITLKGYVNNSDIYDFYKINEVDLFINLSESEGVPVSIMEAQSFGIPVVATDVGGTSEIVNNNLGFLLSDNPTLEEVVEAYTIVKGKDLNREIIKGNWKQKSNAEFVFTEFALDLLKK